MNSMPAKNRMSSAQMSQMRDMHDNDNSDPRQVARAMDDFVRVRASDPAFASFVFAAASQAQAMRRASRPRAV